MFRLSIDAIARTLSLNYTGDGAIIPTGLHFDSRLIQPGDIFVCIRGNRADGADFIDSAIKNGAVAVVAPAQVQVKGAAHIQSEDGALFMQALARYLRSQYHGPVIAITGSQGKTSTKDLLRQVLSSEHHLVVTEGNQNNELGVPLTLMRLSEKTTCLIVEMGMSGFGEIDFLCDLIQPTDAIITNIGIVHAEHLGSREGVARAKTELFKYLPVSGMVALREKDRALVQPYLEELKATPVWVSVDDIGSQEGQTAQGEALHMKDGALDFIYTDSQGHRFPVHLPFYGRHMAENALLLIPLALKLGLAPEIVQEALRKAQVLSKNRMEKIHAGQALILNDSYNANPESMMATLTVLKDYAPRPLVAVLGNMYELGPYELSGHQEVGKKAAELNIDYMITVGHLAEYIGEAARQAGMDKTRIFMVSDNHAALTVLKNLTVPEDAVYLIKGSNSMHMHEIAEALGRRV